MKLYKEIIHNNFRQPPYVDAMKKMLTSGELLNWIWKRLLSAKVFSLPHEKNMPALPVEADKRKNLFPPFNRFWIEQEYDDNITNTKGILGLLVDCFTLKDKYLYFVDGFQKIYNLFPPIGPLSPIKFEIDKESGRLLENTITFVNIVGLPDERIRAVCGWFGQVIVRFLWFINIPGIPIKSEEFDSRTVRFINNKSNRKCPTYKYYTLPVIKPGEKKKTIGKDGHRDLSLHQVRGHIATYDEKGLFGKYYGTFFISDHWRGKISFGLINKDYSLKDRLSFANNNG
jgi:hypothetical protein